MKPIVSKGIFDFICCISLLKVLQICSLSFKFAHFIKLCNTPGIRESPVARQPNRLYRDNKCSLPSSYWKFQVGGKKSERKTAISSSKIHSPAHTWNLSCFCSFAIFTFVTSVFCSSCLSSGVFCLIFSLYWAWFQTIAESQNYLVLSKGHLPLLLCKGVPIRPNYPYTNLTDSVMSSCCVQPTIIGTLRYQQGCLPEV